MSLAYQPPGVNVEELYSPSVSPLLAASAQICLVGRTRGYETDTTQVTFGGDAAAKTITAPVGTIFQKVSTNQSFDLVQNLASGGVYAETTDFTTTLSSDKKTFTITPVASTNLATAGGVVKFDFHYLSDKYFVPTRLDNQAAIEARYGAAYDDNGVVTPLSAAAAFAFSNGAASVVIQPLFVLNDPTNPSSARLQPSSDTNFAAATTWQQSFAGLRDIEDVNILVPVVGQSDPTQTDDKVKDILIAAQNHVNYMAGEGQLMVLIAGEDSSADVNKATAETLRTHATTLRSTNGGLRAEQTVLISPSRFQRVLPSNASRSILMGGQYVAAAVAGMIAARSVVVPLTRKAVAGFVSVDDPRNKDAKNADASAGLLVIEQKGTTVQVRHGITLDNTSTARRELSVVRAKHRMVESVRSTIDSQIIGQVPADGNAPQVVKNAVISVLESLRSARELVDYQGVQARVLTNEPTAVECRFSYLPAFPLNYVNIVFSLDLTSGAESTTFTESAA